MISIAIYGTNIYSQRLKFVIEEVYNSQISELGGETLQVVSFIQTNNDEEVNSDAIVIKPADFIKLYRKNVIQALVIPIQCDLGPTQLVSNLYHVGIDLEDIYYAQREALEEDYSNINAAELLQPYLSYSYLSYLEFHVADHCNLNCKACEHYSGLVNTPTFPDFSKFADGFMQLKRLINDIGIIRILGGEPLLNTEMDKYILLTRKLYPKAIIYIVTNGLLIRQLSGDLLDMMKKLKISFLLSYYPPLQGKISDISKFLDEKGVNYYISPLIEKFTKKQTLIPRNDYEEVFFKCQQAHCHNLYNGKLAACFLPFTTHYFNEYFDQNLPEDGAVDLYKEGLTVEELKKALLTPFQRCRYCTDPVEIDWDVIHKPSILEDWILEQ